MPHHGAMAATDKASVVIRVFMATSIWPVDAASQLLRKINSQPARTIKLAFRRLNSLLISGPHRREREAVACAAG
jgi:hypothetical protein